MAMILVTGATGKSAGMWWADAKQIVRRSTGGASRNRFRPARRSGHSAQHLTVACIAAGQRRS
jgi:hypothetical protein